MTRSTTRRVRNVLQQFQAISFVLPALILLSVFTIYPIGYVIWTSFEKWDLLAPPVAAGLTNYGKIFHDSEFVQSVGNTVLFVVLAVPAQILLGLYLAVLLNNQLKGRGLFRTIFFIPMAMSLVAAGLIFQRMFDTGSNPGFVPSLLSAIGVTFPDWEHTNGFWAMVVVTLMNTWKSTGYTMIVYLAGLQSISPDFYEASAVDGVRTAWQKFRYISWPLLAPTTTLLVITTTIFTFRAFEPFFVMTAGGPVGSTTTMVYYIYNHFANDTGIASAAATVLLMGVMMITVVQYLATRRSESFY